MPSRSLVSVLAALLLVSTAHHAFAQSSDERARGHFLAGSSYFEEGRYLEAAEQFLEAHRLSGRHTLLVNVASAYERAQRFADAATAMERYLETLPEDAEQRGALETRIARIKKSAEEQQRVEAELEEARRLREEASRESESEHVEEVVAPAKSGLNAVGFTGIGLAGAGGAALVVSLVTGLSAKSKHSSLGDRCGPTGDACPPGADADISKGRTMATVSTATLFAGGALAITGVVLLIIGRDRNVDGSAWRLNDGPGEFGLSLTRNF